MPLSYDDTQRLREFYKVCLDSQHQMLGYPVATDYDYQDLSSFFQFSINNVGDWAETSNYPMNTFQFEQDVVEYFCQLFHTNTEKAWGYVTNGGTEGNMYGCYLARERFPDGVVYFSKDTHYSVMKIVRFLNVEHCVVESQANGEMDYDALESALKENPNKPPIIFANIGTTMSGAIDNLEQIQARLYNAGFSRDQYYLHADAAFHGMIIPYVDNPPKFSFRDGIDSISVSGHKMLGSPIPCGMVLALKEHTDKISHQIEYIAAPDKTLTGSRNGLTPLFLWKFIRSTSEQEKRERIQSCLELAEETVQVLNKHNIPAWRNANSTIVVFPKPSEAIWRKHHLAVANGMAHIIIAGQTVRNRSKLNQVLDDLMSEQAYTEMTLSEE
ncbi:histidine decarboxylase [Vibrio coralliilyticus]|uniref:histidine decarboxylase n=1 Tax=Vibrio coralliilyticus TaxID=190893 RepID=UPI0006CC1FC9|nr:histidine decarboxylase [Vibrio coralliilyticus]AXN33600.1 histidine decarboxylase [Vibrio coralliilyticus]KPH23286.1 histidine decarboxylase [Vibrio coralliilyticus]